MSLVYAYSARPDGSVSQMPGLPDSVFRASAGPEAGEPEAAELGAAGADVDGARLVAVVPAAAGVLLLDALLQAAATMAKAASVRARLVLCTEVLESMKILPWSAGRPRARTSCRSTSEYGTDAGKV